MSGASDQARPDSVHDNSGSALFCIGCGYDLRTLPRAGVCPECGMSIEHSYQGDRLSAADPHWLGTVARGVQWVGIGYRGVCVIIFTYCVILLVGVVTYAFTAHMADLADRVVEATIDALPYVTAVFLFMIALGLWWFGTPEPREADRSALWVINRAAVALVVPLYALGFVSAVVGTGLPAIMVNVILVFAVITAAVQVELTNRTARSLAARTPLAPVSLRGKRGSSAAIATVLFAILIVLFVWGPLRWDRTAGGGWQPPNRESQIGLIFWSLVLWLGCQGTVNMLRKAISQERNRAAGASSREQPRSATT